MTDLSTAAQAVKDAAVDAYWLFHPAQVAAALRATVQELKYFGITEKNILAIAAELDGAMTNRSLFPAARAVLARWGRPAIEPAPPPELGVADHITDDEGTRWERTTDAVLWARSFCLICPEMASQEDLMIGWFANAIMAGWDHHGWKIDAERKPVSVSERLPGPEDCDGDGYCWWWDDDDDMWRLSEHRPWLLCWTHWLPHWALPVPQQEAE